MFGITYSTAYCRNSKSTKYTHFLHAYNTQMIMGYYIPRLDWDRGMDGLGRMDWDGMGWTVGLGWQWQWMDWD